MDLTVFGHKKKKRRLYEDLWYELLKRFYSEEIVKILGGGQADLDSSCFSESGVGGGSTSDQKHFPLYVEWIKIHDNLPRLGAALMSDSIIGMAAGDIALRKLSLELLETLDPSYPYSPKILHIRIEHLADDPSVIRQEFPSSKESGILMCLLGTVVKTTNPKLLEATRAYRCTRCKKTFEIESPLEKCHVFPKRINECPNKCVDGKLVEENENDKLGGSSAGPSFRDYQEIKIQEQVLKLNSGAMPGAIWVILEDDLVDSCKPGDDVSITGIPMLRWKPLRPDRRADAELCFKAFAVRVNNDQRSSIFITEETEKFVTKFWKKHRLDPFAGRNHIISSFCPQIYGMYVVKLALLVVLAGGVSKEKNGNRIRGESHMLLVGDPGTGKSQLMKYISKVCPRSVMTTGVGTSSAGLTVSAVKDAGEWHLEAGALVLADGGVCCIDEFSCIKEHDRTSIHEAMEQQSISVAKAGMVCKLSTRCTIIGSTNPKGKYDPNESLQVNLGLATPLLSRFDVLLVLRDAQQDGWDNFVTDFILSGNDPYNKPLESESLNLWTTDQLQSYLVLIKELKPVLSDPAHQVLSNYYQFQRKSAARDASRSTVRLLESLLRLSEGHARLMYREQVELHDAITAVSLIESSMQGSALISEIDSLHTMFPNDPLEEYREQAKLILTRLGLMHLWEAESVHLDKLKSDSLEHGIFQGKPREPVMPVENQRESNTTSSYAEEEHLDEDEDDFLLALDEPPVDHAVQFISNFDMDIQSGGSGSGPPIEIGVVDPVDDPIEVVPETQQHESDTNNTYAEEEYQDEDGFLLALDDQPVDHGPQFVSNFDLDIQSGGSGSGPRIGLGIVDPIDDQIEVVPETQQSFLQNDSSSSSLEDVLNNIVFSDDEDQPPKFPSKSIYSKPGQDEPCSQEERMKKRAEFYEKLEKFRKGAKRQRTE